MQGLIAILFLLVAGSACSQEHPFIEHVGPWKMTIASSQPTVARDFCVKHFNAHIVDVYGGADSADGNNSCSELESVAFPDNSYEGNSDRIPYDFHFEPFNQFMMHFVKRNHRHEVAMSVAAYETHIQNLHTNFTSYSALMDNRVVMETLDLDPICISLARDHVPFFARQNNQGDLISDGDSVGATLSIFVQIPHGGFLEIVSQKLSVVKAEPWNRCESSVISPAVIESEELFNAEYVAPTMMRPVRFVYAATYAQQSARFFEEFLGAKIEASSDKKGSQHQFQNHYEAGDGDCFDTYTVQFHTDASAGTNTDTEKRIVDHHDHNYKPFEIQWVHWKDEAQSSVRREVESYLSNLNGNFSFRSANRWHHFMDNRAGLHVADCAGITQRFDEANIPYFFIKQLHIFGVVFNDSNGISYEFTCPNDSSRCEMDVEDWDCCLELEEPSAFNTLELSVDGLVLSNSHSLLHGEITRSGEPVCRQAPASVGDSATSPTSIEWREAMSKAWDYPLRYQVFMEHLYTNGDEMEPIVRKNIHTMPDFPVVISVDLLAISTLPYNYMHLLRLHFADAQFLRLARVRAMRNTWALSIASEKSMFLLLAARIKQFARGNRNFNSMLIAITSIIRLLEQLFPVHTQAHAADTIDYREMATDSVFRYIVELSPTVRRNLLAQRYVNDTLITLMQRPDSYSYSHDSHGYSYFGHSSHPVEIFALPHCDLSSTDGGSSSLHIFQSSGWSVDEICKEKWCEDLLDYDGAGAGVGVIGDVGGYDSSSSLASSNKYSLFLRSLVMSQYKNFIFMNMTMSTVLVRCPSVVSPLTANRVAYVNGSVDVSASVSVDVEHYADGDGMSARSAISQVDTVGSACESLPGAMLGQYNTVISTSAMLLSRLVFNTTAGPVSLNSQWPSLGSGPKLIERQQNAMCTFSPECDMQNSRAPEALILGLGGAELHSLLVKQHRCMRVQSIEMSTDIIRTAVSHFGVPVCDVRDAEGRDIAVHGVAPCPLTTGVNAVSPPLNSSTTARVCRSRILAADAWTAMSSLRAQGARFDYVISDFFDLQVSEWDGRPDQGQSNPMDLVGISDRVKQVLHPDTGLAIFHVHKDGLFQGVLTSLRKHFDGKSGLL